MSEQMEVVTLKSGVESHGPLVAVTMDMLQHLLCEEAIVFYELVQLCRNRDHTPFGNTGKQLHGFGLVQEHDGRFQVHQATKEIVLAAVEGDGLEMTLGNPVATPQRIP